MTGFANAFLPFATGSSPNVVTDAVYSTLTARNTGFQSGPAISAQYNKVWRQSSIIAAMIGQFTADFGPSNVVDDGNVATLEAQFEAALKVCLISNAAAITPFSSTNSTPLSVSNAVLTQYPIASGSSAFGSASGGVFTFTRAGLYTFAVSGSAGATWSGAGNFQWNIRAYQNGAAIAGGQGIDGNYGTSSTFPMIMNVLVAAAVGDTLSMDVSISAPTSGFSGSMNSAAVTISPIL